MFNQDNFMPLIETLKPIFVEKERQNIGWLRTKNENDIDIFIMELDKGMFFNLKYGKTELVEFREKDGKYIMKMQSELYGTPEMELACIDFLEGYIKQLAHKVDVVVEERRTEIERVYADVLKRRQLKDFRNNSNFCYIK